MVRCARAGWLRRQRRRALHEDGQRAVRRRGDIRQPSICVQRGAGRWCEFEPMRIGAGVGGRGAGPIAMGVAASAVRRAAGAAWLPWTMGPSRSRVARSRTPRRCVSAYCIRTSRVACHRHHTLRCVVAHDGARHVDMPRGVGDTLYASCCMMQCVVWYVAQCGTVDGAHGAVGVARLILCVAWRALRHCRWLARR